MNMFSWWRSTDDRQQIFERDVRNVSDHINDQPNGFVAAIKTTSDAVHFHDDPRFVDAVKSKLRAQYSISLRLQDDEFIGGDITNTMDGALGTYALVGLLTLGTGFLWFPAAHRAYRSVVPSHHYHLLYDRVESPEEKAMYPRSGMMGLGFSS